MKNKFFYLGAICTIFYCMFATSCAIYLPISKIERYFPPTSEVRFINEVQSDMIYIGKLKVVPSDYSFSFDKEKALKAIIKEAKKCGARYLYVKGLNVTSSDYTVIPWDWTLGDGVTVEAELYY